MVKNMPFGISAVKKEINLTLLLMSHAFVKGVVWDE